MPIWGIRITRSSKLLQVDTAYGWVTVWATESLTDESGRVLYSSPNYNELQKQMSLEALQSFVDKIGLLPPGFEVKDVIY